MKILVSGADGLLGSTFKLYKDYDPNFEFIFKSKSEFDITNKDSIESNLSEDIDIFINCAAYLNADIGEVDDNIFNVNYKAIEHLAYQCKKNHILFIHFSSDYVFGGDKSTPYTEEDNINPLNNYGISKVLGEFRLKTIKCSYIIFRITWLYAEFGKNFVRTIIKLIDSKKTLSLLTDKSIYIVNDQIGTPTYSKDLVEAILCIIKQIDLTKIYNSIYNYSNEGVCSFYDFGYIINKLYNDDIIVKPCSTEEYAQMCTYQLAKRPKYSVLDKSKIKKTFNIQIPYWMSSLEKCIKNIKEAES